MKYPIGIQDFKSIIADGYVYVDKTALVYEMVSTGKTYFLSRPRRFGKSLLVSTLKYYYQGEKELFKGLAIDKLEKDWKKYPVFHLDFNTGEYTQPGLLRKKISGVLSAWEQIYGICNEEEDLGTRFVNILLKAHEQTGLRAVVLIDEYDKPILDVLETEYKTIASGVEMTLEENHRNILKSFYSAFKTADQDLQFVLLTGVTKFSQVSIFSGFNQPKDISMNPHYEALCGITEEELYTCFDVQIGELADSLGVTKEEAKAEMKRRYDGYHFSPNMMDIYNPYSILRVLDEKRFSDFWFSTGSPSYLVRLINHYKDDLNEFTGEYYEPSEFIDYKADIEKPLPMIYQSGYLTIKDYEPLTDTFKLDFPNNEVKNGFVTMVASNYFSTEDNAKSWILNIVRALRQADIEKVMTLFRSFLKGVPYSVRRREDERDCERDFQYTFYLIFRMISCYYTYIEKQQSEGRVDCIIETPTDVFIFEFKLDGSADEAMKQIEDRGYAVPYEADTRKVYRIGAVFSSTEGTVSEWKIISE